MKKILLPLLSMFFLLAGCTKTAQYDTLHFHSVSFIADISFDNERFSAECSVDESRNLKTMLISPENLCGLSIMTGDAGTTLVYDNMMIVDTPIFPGESPIKLLKEIINQADAQSFSHARKNTRITGTLGDIDYTLIAAPTGLPILLEISEFDLKIVFKDVTII